MTEGSGKTCVVGVASEEGLVRATLSGDAGMGSTVIVREGLGRLHGLALSSGAREAAVDLTRVGFMSAACVKELATWITTVEGLPPETRYRVRLVLDARVPWQQRSLPTVAAVAPGLVTLETVAS